MVQVINNGGAQPNSPEQPINTGGNNEVPQSTFSGLGTARKMDLAFGVVSISSNAAAFVDFLRKQQQSNEYLARFSFGVVDSVSADYGSAAWVSYPFNEQQEIYGILLFQSGDSIRLRQDNNGVESYFTTIGLCSEDFIKKVGAAVNAVTNRAAIYVCMNDIPATAKVMDEQWANILSAEIMQNIFSRIPGYLGDMKLNRQVDRFTVQVGAVDASRNFLDTNALPHRADFSLTVTHQTAQQQTAEPTIMTDGKASQYPRVHSAGYINLRVTGRNRNSDKKNSLHQMTGEVVCSLMSSQLDGFNCPIERQNIALAGFAEVAQRGGWKDSLIRSLDGTERRLSALLQWLDWGDTAIDTATIKKIDKDPEAIRNALSTFAPEKASLAVNHRVGDGIGGLSTLLYDISVGNPTALAVYIKILDKQFPQVGGEPSLIQALAKVNNTDTLTPNHFVSVSAPTVAGYFTRDGNKHSYEELDPVSVCTYWGDQREESIGYLQNQSYYARAFDQTSVRTKMLKIASVMYAAYNPISTGESVTMAINPNFAALLIKYMHKFASVSVQGITTYDQQANTLFINEGGADLTVGSLDSSASYVDFGGNFYNNNDLSKIL